ncbi:MAG: hypothetical protein U0835_04575 [Isosphaeraceae bacterium]
MQSNYLVNAAYYTEYSYKRQPPHGRTRVPGALMTASVSLSQITGSTSNTFLAGGVGQPPGLLEPVRPC